MLLSLNKSKRNSSHNTTPSNAPAKAKNYKKMAEDDIITFGKYNWRILDVKEGRVLIITEDIVERRWYHNKFIDITWADCHLRKYLNKELYNKFSQSEKKKIITVTNRNLDNPWFRTKGGKDTNDNIFLLSLKDVCEYFGDSRAKLQNKDHQTWYIDDKNNSKRQAEYSNNFHWWRLHS